MIQIKKAWIFILFACVLLSAVVIIPLHPWGKKGADRMAVALHQTYENPFVLDQEWEDYGIGAPYVLRYDGKNYLYYSTKDRRVGVKARSSDSTAWTVSPLTVTETD
jgi:xylan 1,4-beta-xylosidase